MHIMPNKQNESLPIVFVLLLVHNCCLFIKGASTFNTNQAIFDVLIEAIRIGLKKKSLNSSFSFIIVAPGFQYKRSVNARFLTKCT